ncbi:Cytosolic carboxypeptidase 1 [Armadillidium vulgare]|nr:Cytosolic carboxypeptidase 1 [Armadillidium vulgare]
MSPVSTQKKVPVLERNQEKLCSRSSFMRLTHWFYGNIRQNLIKSLVHNNTTEALFRCFRNLPSSLFCKSDLGLIHGLQVIAKLASKDAKMAVKCRLVGGVKLTHQLIHTHSKNNQLLLPLLIILKFITKNPTNQMVLGKDGCVTTLLNLLNSLPKTHWAKIKLILENLALLTKTKSNVVRLVRENGIVKLLSLLESWEKTEKRHQVKVLRSLLSVLSHLCDSKHGRKAVIGLKGNEVLHKFIMSCPSDSKFDSILGIALNVFLKCSSKDELPVMSLRGAFIFRTASLETSSQSNFDSRDSTTELDRDSSDDEDEFGEDDDDEDDSKGFDLATSYNPQTTRIEDLIKMAVFFQEYQDFNLDKENEVPKSNSKLKKEEISISEMYLQQSSSTKTFINFVKVAYPDMIMAEGPSALEPLYQKNSRVIREKALRTVDRVLNASTYHEKVVFDLDYLLKSDHSRQLITPMDPPIRSLNNWDEKRVGKKDISIAPYEYDLVINSDVNSWHHHQWFYFEVSNMEAGVPYIFNIINNEKPNSEFNFGMKPVIFSAKDSLLGRTAWVRTGYDICYHKNHFARIPKNSENSKFRKGTGKSYYTVSMTIKFPHSNDVVYLAYHYPYTFTKLQFT